MNIEETNKPLTFEELSNRPPKKVGKKTLHTGIPVKVNNVTVYFKDDSEETFPESMTLEELLDIDQRKPGIVASVSPNLYSVFQSSVNKTLEPYVKVGDTVVFAKKIYMPVGKDIKDQYTVLEVELASIGSMSVFVAKLSDGTSSVLTNFLKVV